MFFPPPASNDRDKNRFSEKVVPPTPSPAHANSATPSDEEVLPQHIPHGDELLVYILNCLEQGSTRAEIRKQLIAFGHPSSEAHQLAEGVADWRKKNPSVQAPASTGGGSCNSKMMIGGAICLIGLLVTIGRCLAASGGGGSYVVAWGAVVFGAIQFFRGMSQSNDS